MSDQYGSKLPADYMGNALQEERIKAIERRLEMAEARTFTDWKQLRLDTASRLWAAIYNTDDWFVYKHTTDEIWEAAGCIVAELKRCLDEEGRDKATNATTLAGPEGVRAKKLPDPSTLCELCLKKPTVQLQGVEPRKEQPFAFVSLMLCERCAGKYERGELHEAYLGDDQ